VVAARLVPVGALTIGVLTVVVPSSASGRPTTYAAASTGAAIADLTAGFALVLVGALVAGTGRHGAVGPLTALLGVAWLAPDWVGWDHGWPIGRSLAAVVTPLGPALLAHLALTFPSGRTPGGKGQVLVIAAYAATGLPALVLAVVGDPALDRYCWANCSANAFLVHADLDLARAATVIGRVAVLVTGLGVAVWCAWRVARATSVARRVRTGVLLAVGGVATTATAYSTLLLTDPAEDPEATRFVVIFLLRAGLLIALAATVSAFAVAAARVLARVDRLAGQLGDAPPPGTLRAELARSLGDEAIEVAYWLPGPGRWSDASGHPVDPEPGPGRAVTTIVRDGNPVALVTHDAELRGVADLGVRIGAAARLAVDNERLQAQLMARVDEVRASRARIVAVGDATRRRLERDLHDGAQQRLLAVAYELRLAREEAPGELTPAVDAATAETLGTLTDMRELAQGIFPAILSDAGIAAALRTYAERAPVELNLGPLVPGRYPFAAEVAAYTVVTDTVERAASSGSGRVGVSVVEAAGGLMVLLTGDMDTSSAVADRVAALGGRIARAETGTEVSIPCASS
jgi:signal transduction histidine kinase